MNHDRSIGPDVLLEIIRVQAEIARLGIDLGAVMNTAAAHAAALTRADGAAIELREGDMMVYRAACGLAGAQLGLRLPVGGSLSGLCLASRTVQICRDSETDERVDRAACRQVGLRSMLLAPLRHGETCVGVLKIMSRERNAFGAREAEIVGLFTGLVASAMFHSAAIGSNALYYRATHDPLTGLANRALFFDRLHHALGLARDSRTLVGLVYLDMDRLKPINDQYGHRAGDAVLVELAERLRTCIRPTDTVARLGGDEFAVLCLPIGSAAELAVIGERILEQLGAPFAWSGRPLTLSASLGTALFPDHGDDATRLVEAADAAMYLHKQARQDDPAPIVRLH